MELGSCALLTLSAWMPLLLQTTEFCMHNLHLPPTGRQGSERLFCNESDNLTYKLLPGKVWFLSISIHIRNFLSKQT